MPNNKRSKKNLYKDYDYILQSDRAREFSMELVYETIRRNKIVDAIKRYAGKRILDIGCGPNPIFLYIEDFFIYVGIEPSKLFYDNAIKLAGRLFNGNVKILLGKVEETFSSIPDEKYDIIVISSLLQFYFRP